MTLMLVNESKKEAITLRYGDGLNKRLQINPGKQAECPIELRRSLLQHYLATFKDLKLIDNSTPVKVEGQDNVKETNSTKSEVPQEKTETQDGGESTNNDTLDEGDSKDGESDSSKGDGVNGESNLEGGGEGAGSDNAPVLTEKVLNKLSAGEIKELATKLGIEVTDESTKKALIPVILNKQGK